MSPCRKRLFLLQETQCWTSGEGLSFEKEKAGKRGQSLGNGVDPNAERADAEITVAATEDSALQVTENAVETAQQRDDVAGKQGAEDSTPGPQDEVENLADETEAAQVVLLCISGTLEGFPVNF